MRETPWYLWIVGACFLCAIAIGPEAVKQARIIGGKLFVKNGAVPVTEEPCCCEPSPSPSPSFSFSFSPCPSVSVSVSVSVSPSGPTWGGSGWYCIRQTNTTWGGFEPPPGETTCDAEPFSAQIEITSQLQWDGLHIGECYFFGDLWAKFEYLSGPYDTLAEAQSACP